MRLSARALLVFWSLWLFLPTTAPAAPKTVLLLPIVIYGDPSKAYLREGIKSMFRSRLAGEDLKVLSDEALEGRLSEEEKLGIDSKPRAEELARQLGAEYAIYGSVTTVGGGYSLDLSILGLSGDEVLVTRVSEAMSEDQFIPKLAGVVTQFRAAMAGPRAKPAPLPEEPDFRAPAAPSAADQPPEDETAMGLFYKPAEDGRLFEPTGRASIRLAVAAFDTSDLDGDGIAEWLVLGRKKLFIYQMRGGSLELLATLDAPMGEDYLKVSAGDGNGDGKDEIYLVGRYGDRARSTILEWSGKEFKRLHRQGGHLRILKDSEGGDPVILFQDSKVDGTLFFGKIATRVFADGELTEGEELPTPEQADFYSLALYDLDRDGEMEYIGVGRESRLYLWDRNGQAVWRSDERFGGSNNHIQVGRALGREFSDRPDGSAGFVPPRFYLSSRMVIADVDKDGVKEAVVPYNKPLVGHIKHFKAYTKSRLFAFRFEGMSLSQAWQSKEFGYAISDIQMDGQTLFIATQKGKIEDVTKGSSRIMWFR